MRAHPYNSHPHLQSLFLLLLLVPSPLHSSILPYGNIGDPPLFILDVSLSQNEMECVHFDGVGDPSEIFIQLYFEQFNEIHSQASDFLLTLSPILNSSSSSSALSSPSCVMQGGYNIFPSSCQYLDQWNQSWARESNILVQDNIYPPSSVQGDAWKFCVGNGWAGAQEFVRYQALVVLFGIQFSRIWDQTLITFPPTFSPTSAPTMRPTTQIDWKNMTYPTYDSKEVLSSCDENPTTIQFSVTLGSHQKSCLTFFGSGLLSSLKIALNYTLHSPSITQPEDIYQGLSDLALTLTNTQPTNHNKVQIGGLTYLDDSIEGTLLSWPETFENLAISFISPEIEITIPADPLYDLGSSQDSVAHYEICLHNTYASHSSLPVTYQAHISFPNIQHRCDGVLETNMPTATPTLSPTSPPVPSTMKYDPDSNSVLLSVDLSLQSETRDCVEFIFGGSLTSIHSRLSFRGNNFNWVSDIILSIEDSESTLCHQVEGQTVSFHLEQCSYLGTWPNDFNQIADGFYEAFLDIQKPLAFPSYSPRKVSLFSFPSHFRD